MTQKPAPSRRGCRYGGHIRANGIRQHYLRFGEGGPPLLLIPGIISTAAMWAFVAERLSQYFDVYVLDVRGRGLSECGEHLDYGLDACAGDIVEFAGALKLPPYIVVGHSMGARIAIRAARATPAGLERIVLIDPPVAGPGRRVYPIPLLQMLNQVRAAQLGDVSGLLRLRSPAEWPEAQLLVRAEWLHTCDERAVEAAYRGFHEDDIHTDLRFITKPTDFILASRGDVTTPADADEIRRLLPGSAIRYVADAGHQIQLDNIEGLFETFGEVFNRAFS